MKGNRKSSKKFINERFAKSGMYKNVLEDIGKARVCPFCPRDGLASAWKSARPFGWHTKPILQRRGGWLITKSFQPYENTAHHFLVIGRKHKEHIQNLTALDWREISDLVTWATKNYKLAGGGVALRFGNTAHTGATVSHLHLHLIVPKMKNGRAMPVLFPFG